MSLFRNIQPLFQNKPLFILANKTDACPIDQLDEQDRGDLQALVQESGATLMTMSTLTEEGVMDAKNAACDQLLKQRVDSKVATRKVANVRNRLHVAMPKKRDGKTRAASVPASVVARREAKANGMAMDEDDKPGYEDPHAFGGTFNYRGKDLTEQYMLANDDWKTDIIPEIMDGKNVAEFYDPDIMAKLDALEKEEEALLDATAMEPDSTDSEDEETLATVKKIRDKKAKMVASHRREKGRNTSVVPKKFRGRTMKGMKEHLAKHGVRPAASIDTRGTKRRRSLSRAAAAAERDETAGKKPRTRSQSQSARARSRSKSVVKTPAEMGVKDEKMKKFALKLKRMAQRPRNRNARKGEGDREILNMMPKHLYSGKRGIGKTDRR